MGENDYECLKMAKVSSETYPNSSVNECEDCGFAFIHKKNLYAHMGNIDDRKVNFNHTNSEQESVLCAVCGKLSTTNTPLTKPRKNAHDIQEKSRTFRMKCTECGCKNISSYGMLRRHLKVEHNKEVLCEQLYFKSSTDFQEWKSRYQKKHSVCYVLGFSQKHLSNCEKQFYYCQGSHTYKRSASGLRPFNTTGTSKVDAACSSTIEVLITHGTYNVKFFSTHVGHGEYARLIVNANANVKLAGVLDKIARRRWQGSKILTDSTREERELSSEIQEQIRQKCELIAELNQVVEISKESKEKICLYLDKVIGELIGASKFRNSEAISLNQGVYRQTRNRKPKHAQI